jgi:hypothetical protein
MALTRRRAAPRNQFDNHTLSPRCARAHGLSVEATVQRCSLQEIFCSHFKSYAATRRLHARESRAASCISHCYGPGLGAHALHCEQGHFQRLQWHACRHRCCPQCAQPARTQWIDAQLQRLLPCPHHHVVFTLPHELLPLWEFDRARLSELLFESVRSTVLTLLGDPERLGVMPGIVMSLHTWGRNLSHHPHMHCLVSAGGLSAQGDWRASRERLLLPIRPLQQLFRGKMLGGLNALLKAQRLSLPPQHDREHWYAVNRVLYDKHWNIEIMPAYPHGAGVARYLARYVKGGPIGKGRVLLTDGQQVRMRYKDHRRGEQRWLHLSCEEFIARVLWHAPVPGQHTTRSAGLYCSARRHQRAAAARALALKAQATPTPLATCANAPQPAPAPLPRPERTPALCPLCSRPLIRLLVPHSSAISLYPPRPPPARFGTRGPTIRSRTDSPRQAD